MQSISEPLRDAWHAFTGPDGWRTVAWPATFAALALGLLVFDHLQNRIPHLVFWLCVGLIGCVFAWLVEAARRKSRDLSAEQRMATVDRVTGLASGTALLLDLERALARGERRSLIVLELGGLQSHYDDAGVDAGDALVRGIALQIQRSAQASGGTPYRLDSSRFAIQLAAGGRTAAELVAALGHRDDGAAGLLVGHCYGEVALPEEADAPEAALRLAGQRISASRQRQQRSARRQAHAVLMAALEARRPELRLHVRDVAFRSIALSRRLGLDGEAIDDIFLAAELQDIGLLTVPEAVLEKRSPLDERESDLIRQHPIAGERIVAAAADLAPVSAIVRSISERFDGEGFPDRLGGSQIPIGARIIAVLVAFAAMTSVRPYRPARTAGEALTELRACAGLQFDPDVVEALAADLEAEASAHDGTAVPALS